MIVLISRKDNTMSNKYWQRFKKAEHSYIAGGIVKKYSHFEKQTDNSSSRYISEDILTKT